MKNTLCILSFSISILCAQTQVDLKMQSKQVDFTGASFTKPVRSGTSVPVTCGVGEFFFNTSAPAGANLYACTSTNTFTLQGGGFKTGSGAPVGICAVGQTYFDTVNGNTWFCESPGSWMEVLTTTGIGPFSLTGANSAGPAVPAAGSTALFFSSTAKVGQTLDNTGAIATMVRPTDCSGAGQLAQKINSNGTVSCAGSAVVEFHFPAGAGSSASASTGQWWQDGSTPTVCPSGAPYQCSLHWNSGGATIAVTAKVPHAWNGGAVSVLLTYQGNGSGNTVQPAISSGCITNGGAGPAFNAAQNFGSQATSGSTYYVGTLSGLTTTGCSADGLMVLRFSRADSAGFMSVASASVMFNIP